MTMTRQIRVLIVDDEEPNLARMESVVKKAEGVVVGKATSLEMALRVLGEVDVDLVLSDFSLGRAGETGAHIAPETNVPVLIVTSLPSEIMKKMCEILKVRAVFRKWDKAAIIAAILEIAAELGK